MTNMPPNDHEEPHMYLVEFDGPPADDAQFSDVHAAFIAAAVHVAGSKTGQAMISKQGAPAMFFYQEGTDVIVEYKDEKGATYQSARPIAEVLSDPDAKKYRRDMPFTLQNEIRA